MPWKSLRMSDNFARDRSADVFTDKYDGKGSGFPPLPLILTFGN